MNTATVYKIECCSITGLQGALESKRTVLVIAGLFPFIAESRILSEPNQEVDSVIVPSFANIPTNLSFSFEIQNIHL